jgi:peptide/nickel transport system permease protein
MSLVSTNEVPGPTITLGGVIRAIGFIGLGAIGVTVGLSDVLARAPADAVDYGPPLIAPSVHFPLGTDVLGRDMASETLHALAVTVTNAGIAAIVVVVAGGLAGFIAARLPYRIGFLLRGIAGILGAVPALLLAILFIGLANRGLAPFAAGLAAAPLGFVRAFDRARALGQSRHAEFARATGISPGALLRRDLTYEFRDSFLSIATRALAAVTIVLSTVSFFGYGATPPHRDLGLMIAAARDVYFDAWWTAAIPAIALALFVLCARLAAGLDEGERA